MARSVRLKYFISKSYEVLEVLLFVCTFTINFPTETGAPDVFYVDPGFEYVRQKYQYSEENKVWIAKDRDMEVRDENQLELPGTDPLWSRQRTDYHRENGEQWAFGQEGPHYAVYDIPEVEAVEIDTDEWEEEAANLYVSEDEYIVPVDPAKEAIYLEGQMYHFMMRDSPQYHQLKKEVTEQYPEEVAKVKSEMELKRKEEREERKAKKAEKKAKKAEKKARKEAAEKAAESEFPIIHSFYS